MRLQTNLWLDLTLRLLKSSRTHLSRHIPIHIRAG